MRLPGLCRRHHSSWSALPHVSRQHPQYNQSKVLSSMRSAAAYIHLMCATPFQNTCSMPFLSATHQHLPKQKQRQGQTSGRTQSILNMEVPQAVRRCVSLLTHVEGLRSHGSEKISSIPSLTLWQHHCSCTSALYVIIMTLLTSSGGN